MSEFGVTVGRVDACIGKVAFRVLRHPAQWLGNWTLARVLAIAILVLDEIPTDGVSVGALIFNVVFGLGIFAWTMLFIRRTERILSDVTTDVLPFRVYTHIISLCHIRVTIVGVDIAIMCIASATQPALSAAVGWAVGVCWVLLYYALTYLCPKKPLRVAARVRTWLMERPLVPNLAPVRV